MSDIPLLDRLHFAGSQSACINAIETEAAEAIERLESSLRSLIAVIDRDGGQTDSGPEEAEAKVAALFAEVERLKKSDTMKSEALSRARRDIWEWLQLARRQREELPDADHLPCAPTDAGIAASESVLEMIDRTTQEAVS